MSKIGVHLALDRDNAKRLFGCRDEVARMSCVHKIRSDLQGSAQENELGESWETFHRCLSRDATESSAGDDPLDHCILGGRHLCDEDDLIVFVRPDMVPHLADSLAKIDETWWNNRCTQLDIKEVERDVLWELVKTTAQFFKQVAHDRHAVVFTTVA